MALGAVTPGLPNVDYVCQSRQASAEKTAFCPETEGTNDEERRVIGLTMLPYGSGGMSYSMTARYASESTESDPIVQVISNYGGKTVSYNIPIKEVNPRNATQLEMFALLSYTDDRNISDGGNLGSYQKMKNYADNAVRSGYWEGNGDYDSFVDTKHDWQGIVISMWDDYAKAGVYSQMVGCMNLNETMEKYSIWFVDFDKITFEDRSDEASLTYKGAGELQSAMAAWQTAAEEAAADTKKTEETAETHQETEGEAVDYLQMIQEYMDELFEKIKDGDTEPKFQLGGRAYTVREWNELLEQFDSALDAIRQQIREQIEEQLERSKEAGAQSETAGLDMITVDTVQARFPMQAVDDEGNPTEDIYLTAIDRDGIRCSKPGSDTYEWEIRFTEEGQYEKATAFMEWANEHMDNFLFAAHENFWQDFLGGRLDVTAFQEFLTGTNNGIPNYGITVGDSTYIDESKVQWAKYMNHPGAKFYTAQEMAEMVAAEIEKNQAKLTKLTNPYDEVYRKYHPEYDGSAIFCEYPGGPLYTANEIGERMLERVMLEKDRSTSWSVRRALGLQ